MTQVVEHLPRKHEAVSSRPSIIKRKPLNPGIFGTCVYVLTTILFTCGMIDIRFCNHHQIIRI
jgi:hypothetical protein